LYLTEGKSVVFWVAKPVIGTNSRLCKIFTIIVRLIVLNQIGELIYCVATRITIGIGIAFF